MTELNDMKDFFKKQILFLMLILSTLILCGCDAGIKQMGATEYGVIFRHLPPFLGGGISTTVITNGQKVIIWPWDSILRFDTSDQMIRWGGNDRESDSRQTKLNYLYTRAYDGNEVALSVSVVYQIVPNKEEILALVNRAVVSNQAVRELVVSIGQADIRSHMNRLRTAEFADSAARYQAISGVQKAMNERLEPFGVRIVQVTLDDFQFERLARDGSVDSSYQEKLTQIQKLNEDTNRELSRIQTIQARKEKEFNEAQAEVNRLLQEAEGYKNQIKIKADAYSASKLNESKAKKATGDSEIAALKEQIAALAGSGGEALVKLRLLDEILKNNPKFLVIGEKGSSSSDQAGASFDVRHLDTNKLLEQLGAVEALNARRSSSAKK
jgi:regulator of protease activity HflC (stomatin/prohibitin superfamily)